MKFEEALPLLKQGKRIIRTSLQEQYEYFWLNLYNGEIDFMNEPWHPSAEQLREDLLADDWAEVIDEKDEE